MKKLYLFISIFVALQIASAETLTITFLDSETSNPIEGVTGFVDVINNNTPSVPTNFVSDANGMVEIANLQEGLANLWASAVGYYEVYMYFSFPEESDLVISMTPGFTNNVNDTLNIQVLDSETGEPIEGVEGTVFSASFFDFLLPFNTDQDGLATFFDFPTGPTEILASAFGYENLYQSFDFTGEDLVMFEMNPSGTTDEETDTLNIYFVDSETGDPISNVNGFVNGFDSWIPFQFVADDSGSVVINNFPYGTAEIYAHLNGYHEIFMSFNFPDQNPLVIEMNSYEAPPIETDTLKMVFVNSETGDIIPSVEGYVISFGTWDMVYNYEFMSNELGYTEVYGFPIGLAEVYAYKLGFMETHQFFEFTGEESANMPGDSDVITIYMDPVGPPDYDSDTLIVHFVDALTGQPVSDVGGYLMSNVGNDWNGLWSITFHTDEQGTAIIPMVPFGIIEIYGSCFGYLDHSSLFDFSVQSEIEIIIYPIEQITNAIFSGSVTVPDGVESFFPPIVFAISMDSSETTFQNFVDQNGNYTLPVLSGEYQIGAVTLLSGGTTSLGLQMQFYDNVSNVYDATPVSIADGELIENINFSFSSEDIVLNADYGSMVMGQVGNDDSASMENTIITVQNENGMMIAEGTVDASQMYMISGLDQNQLYFISASHDSYGIIEEAFTSSSMMSVKNFQFASIQLESDSDSNQIPNDFTLEQNFPNPFNPITTIRYTVSGQEKINISIYDMRGNLVKNLLNSIQWPGIKTVQWDATDNYGVAVSAGVYLYKIQAGIFSETKKMILLK